MSVEHNLFEMWDEGALAQIADAARSDREHAIAIYLRANKDFMSALRSAYGVKFGLPNPAAALRLGAWLIRTEAELLLTGRRVAPAVLQKENFDFRYPRLEDALTGLIRQPKIPNLIY